MTAHRRGLRRAWLAMLTFTALYLMFAHGWIVIS